MKLKLFSGLAALLFLFSACNNDDDNLGNWVELSSLDGFPRSGVVSFTIDDTGYMGLGVNTSLRDDDDDFNEGTFGEYITDEGVMRDFWAYDGVTNRWTQLASFGGKDVADVRALARKEAVAFAAGGKGFVGTGRTYTDQDGWEETEDFWAYDPTANNWTQIDNFPGGKRYNAVAFAIGNYGYVGCGINGNTFKDFYRFDATTMTWETEGIGFGGDKREGAQAFVLNEKAYVVSGRNNGEDLMDVWMFDPAKLNETSAWVKQIDLDDSDFDFENVRRSNGVAFAVGGRGYVATGTRGGSSLRDCWEFDPNTQEWEEKQEFEGAARKDAAVFVLNGSAYVGISGSSDGNVNDDIWRFDPFAEYESED